MEPVEPVEVFSGRFSEYGAGADEAESWDPWGRGGGRGGGLLAEAPRGGGRANRGTKARVRSCVRVAEGAGAAVGVAISMVVPDETSSAELQPSSESRLLKLPRAQSCPGRGEERTPAGEKKLKLADAGDETEAVGVVMLSLPLPPPPPPPPLSLSLSELLPEDKADNPETPEKLLRLEAPGDDPSDS